MELDILPLDLASDTHRPLVIAGPCSAETEEQVINTAKALAQKVVASFELESGNHAQSLEVLKAMAKWH